MKYFLEKTLRQKVIMKENVIIYEKLPLVYRGKYTIFNVELNGVLWIAIQPRNSIGLIALRKDRDRISAIFGIFISRLKRERDCTCTFDFIFNSEIIVNSNLWDVAECNCVGGCFAFGCNKNVC